MAKIVTITNPLTGQPAQVDQLDHTAQQIDDGIARALPGGYYDKWVSQLPGQDLLDNSVFVDGCLVDQRQGYVVKPNTTYYSDNQLTTAAGTTSSYVTAYRYATGTASGVSYASFKLTDTDTAPTFYAAPANVVRGYTASSEIKYTFDRWTLGYVGTVYPSSDGLTIINPASGGTIDFGQTLEFSDTLFGYKATISILISGVLYSKSVSIPSSPTPNTVIDGIGFDWGKLNLIYYSTGYLAIVCRMNPLKTVTGLRGVKLDLGDQQTLAHQDENGNWVLNELPNYADTLARCQRMFFSTAVTSVYGPTFRWDASHNSFAGNLNFPVTMRTRPVIIGNEWVARNNYDGSYVTVSSAELFMTKDGLFMIYQPTFSSGTPVDGCEYVFINGLKFSAEL